ncbi:MAG: sodium:alanine symporter family protein [Bdellovibrionaceae bacterium]|nr:sodium:alanine symporter family protein [Pseudobdellovibrionaceae bacterium]
MNSALETVVGYVWGLPMVFLLVGTGILLTVVLGFPQLKGFLHAIQVVRGKFDDPDDPGEISHFQALCTALSATVGLGNIAGVAVAIHLGGPGATFWMVVTGLVGMATKFSECSISMMYRHVDERGIVHGGGFHYIERGLGKAWKPMAVFFALACICASFGAANMFQTNQVAAILESNFNVPPLATGLTLAIATAVVIIGGIKRIGQVTSTLVPFMGGIYIIGSLIVIFANLSAIPSLLMQIFSDAFSGTAAEGAFAGIAVREVLVQGVRRACFSNEAGLGSAPIAHSAASTKEPVREGAVALLEPFIDTVVICTMTALVILLSGAWTQDANGVELTALAFDSAMPGFGRYFVPVAVTLFAYSTLLSWSYYGERAVDYMIGEKGILAYKIIFCVVAVAGALWAIGPVLNFSDLMLGLMVIPNLIAVLILLPKLRQESSSYFGKLRRGEFKMTK